MMRHSPLSVTPEEHPALLHEIERSWSCSQSSTPTQIAGASVSFAINKRPPPAKPLLTYIRVSDSQKFTESLHDWSNSIDGFKTYHCLVETASGALLSDELMLCLSALVMLHSIMRSIKSDDTKSSKPVELINFHYLLTRESLFRAIKPFYETWSDLLQMQWLSFE